MRRTILMLLSLFFFNALFAQSNDGTIIIGEDVGWGDGYDLIYKVDGSLYKKITLEEGAIITPEPAPTKEGYTFSGWSEIPATMPAKDVEITGTFSINSYNLTYFVDDVEYKTFSIEYGSTITSEQAPTKEGYTFSGWSDIPTTMPANDVRVTGTFCVNSYTLTYMLDGVAYKTLTVKYGTEITPEADPTKEGYTFSGWSEIPATMPAQDVTVTGSFSQNTYKLIYKIDGEVYKQYSIGYGSTITAEPAPTKEGYTFSGWSDIPATMPAKDVEITGSFSINSYTLTYMLDGVVYKTLTVKYGTEIMPEADPVKEGFTFSGWVGLPKTMPAQDVTVTGSFSQNTYKLTYKVDGEVYKQYSIGYGYTITAEPVPVKEGYTFSGWSDIPATMPAKDVEITGSFSINSYKLTYIVDGAAYKSYTIEYGTSITVEQVPTKEGYTFSGWSDIPQTMPAKDVKVTGTFSVNSYTLTYILDGAVYKTQTVKYGTAIDPEADPTKEGYTFSGWSDIPSTMPANDVRVTGTFSVNSYTLTYVLEGVVYKTLTVKYGTEITPEADPTKEGYTFSGWVGLPKTMPAQDVTVTGTFGQNTYKLTYKVDGEIYKQYAIEYGTTITAEPAPVKEGYTFSGWSEIPATMPARDVEITGTFSINSYKLIYYVDDTEYKNYTIEYGASINAEPVPSKEGYTFSGWSEIPATMPANDVIVTGFFSINSYKLTYVVDDVEYKTYSIEYGSAITAEQAPTKEGYTFSGWSDIPQTMLAKDVTITGTFSVNSYTLTYMLDGVAYKTVTVKYGTEITPEADPTKEGYTFSGWVGLPQTMPAQDVTVTGSFGQNTYKLSYKVDGEIYKQYSIGYGSTITAEPAPTKEGYTFSGWSDIPATMPAKDVEITGSFSINSYTLTYMLDGVVYKTLTVKYGTEIMPEDDPVKEGFTFSGWVGLPQTMPAQDVTVTGSFGQNTYKLTYKVDGEIYKQYAIEYGVKLTVEPAPYKEGYTFSGWSEIPEFMPANDIEISGSFSINSYSLIYIVDGETYKFSTVEFGTEIIAEPEPIKDGYTFSGWSEIPEKMPSNDVKISGSFTVNRYLLIVIVDDEQVYSDSIAYGTRLAEYVDILTEQGIDITQWEWYKDIDVITMPSHDVTINAVFSSVHLVLDKSIDTVIYDLTGNQMKVDDISALPSGIYIRNGHKFIIR